MRRERFTPGILRASGAVSAVLMSGFAVFSPASAQTVQEVKDAFEMMVGSAAICSDYLARPEILADARKLGTQQFENVGVSAAEADVFMDAAVEEAMKEPSTEMQKQVACEIVNVPTLN